MKNRLLTVFSVALFLGFIAEGIPVMAQSVLGVSEVVQRVLEADPSVVLARRQVDQAFRRYELTLAGTIPDLTLRLTPYSYARQRISAGQNTVMADIDSAALGLEVRQALPSSGTISLGANHTLRRITSDGEATLEQVPDVTLGFRQPLFVNGDLLGNSVFEAGRRAAEIAFQQATVSATMEQNNRIRNALDLLLQVVELRRSLSFLENTIELLQRQLDVAELDREQGLLSDNAVLALQVALNDRREAQFDTQLALVQVEQLLARSLGEESLNSSILDDSIDQFTTLVDERIRWNPEESPLIRTGRYSVESARQQELTAGLTDRPQVGINVTASPLYPVDRDDPGSISTSLTDYFVSDADLSATVALSLEIPLLTRRERALREQINATEVEQAQIRLDDTRQAVLNQLQTLRIHREFLQQRGELLDTDIEYQQRRLQNENDLLAAGATTDIRVEEVTLDLTARENERWEVGAELFLNALDILVTTGQDLAAVLE